MADNGLPLKGFTPAEALWRLLRLKGYEGNIVAFQDAYPVDGSAPSMIAPLEAHNVQARAAMVRMRNLRYLEAPTLLQLKGRIVGPGAWHWQKETASGITRRKRLGRRRPMGLIIYRPGPRSLRGASGGKDPLEKNQDAPRHS